MTEPSTYGIRMLDRALYDAMQSGKRNGGLPASGCPHISTFKTDGVRYEVRVTRLEGDAS